MSGINSKIKKNIPIILAALIFIFILIPQKVVYAGIVTDWISGRAIGGVVWLINLIIGFIAGVAFTLAGVMVNWTLKINESIMGQPVVAVGWNITLQFANLGFVLVIIVIAFATILRIESYGMKKTLFKLITAALLVNFSLVIAGAFISVADVVTKVFQEKAVLGPVDAATTFANAFKIQKFLEVGQEGETTQCDWQIDYALRAVGGASANSSLSCTEANEGQVNPDGSGNVCKCITYPGKDKKLFEGVSGIGKSLFSGIASILFTVAFTIIAAISLFALAIMLLIRFLALGILLVLSPLAFLAWIFPATNEHWKKWWSEFIRWTFFAPAVMFFLYLAIQSTKGIGALDFSANDPATKGLEASLLQSGVTSLVGNMMIILGFLIGGLYVANKMSITFAKNAYGAAVGATKGLGGWAGKKGVRTTGWLTRRSDRMLDWATNPKSGKTKQFIGRKMYGIQSGLSKVPVVKKLGQAYGKPGQPHKIDKGLVASVWGGMKSGSGLFKKKEKAKDWECQICGNIIRASKKPSGACSNCASPAVTANWQEV